MINYHLICDESGRSGYTDKGENELGEFSVVAGVLIPDDAIPYFVESLNIILKKYSNSMKSVDKFHITDLKTNIEQEELREDLFGLLSDYKLPLIYQASYLNPFSEAYKKQKELLENAVSELKKNSISATNGIGQFKKNIQVECFGVMYTKAIVELALHFNSPVSLTVVTDKMDAKLVNAYKDKIDERHFLKSQRPLVCKRFYYETGEKEEKRIDIHVHYDEPLNNIFRLSCGKIGDATAIHAIVADVISNSLYYYLRLRIKEKGFGPLNEYDAIKDHPLANQFIGMSSTAFDKLYSY